MSLNTFRPGLGRVESLIRRDRYGPNEIASERPPSWHAQLLHAFHTPFTYLLLVLAVMTVSSNFSNVFSVLVASVWLPFLPMLAIHLLIQNRLYDISQISIAFDRTDEEC